MLFRSVGTLVLGRVTNPGRESGTEVSDALWLRGARPGDTPP